MNKPKSYSPPKKQLKPNIIVLKGLKGVPNVATTLKPGIQKQIKLTEVDNFKPSATGASPSSQSLGAENACCKEKQKIINNLTRQNVDLKSKCDRIVKAHDTLKTEYLLLEKKYKEKMEECRKEHYLSRPPILSVSKYIELF